jgi:hypothetical protein
MNDVNLETRATWVFRAMLAPMIGFCIGCEPEMPAPPPKVFGSSAEEDFDWAMVRMKHAIEMFRPSSSADLSMKRELDYELMPPSEAEPKYTARVTISTRTVFRADTPTADEKRRRAEEKKEAAKIKLDNPYKIPGDESGDEDAIPLPDVPLAELSNPEIANPRVPTQQLKEKKDFLLEYADGEWQLKTPDIEKNERMLFDYALQQGEFGPGAAAGH